MGPIPFTYTDSKGRDWHLHTKEVTLRNGHNQTIYFFARNERAGRCELPAGFEVMETKRTGMPVLRKV